MSLLAGPSSLSLFAVDASHSVSDVLLFIVLTSRVIQRWVARGILEDAQRSPERALA
jgi:hypothetical protein